KQWDNYEFIW
nr:Chain B, peptide substrate [synthetic construct]